MHYRLANGVNLEIIPSKKFNMNQILINFATPQTAANATARNLLANLLETSTQKYPTQTALAEELAMQYGTYLNIDVNRVGYLHCIRLKASFINDRLAKSDLFDQVMSLVGEVIFNPLVAAGRFDQETFHRQLVNLKSTIDGFYDDKQFWAARRLLDLYYRKDSVLQVPSFGRVKDLVKITPASLYQTYQDMVSHDRVDILFLGDEDPNKVKEAFERLSFPARSNDQLAIMYQQPLYRQVQRQVEYQALSQAKLNIGYQLPVYCDDERYYAGLVFNDLFGGSPYSKLFLNIRERASLAYYASSRLMPFNGLLSVQSGIDSRQSGRVEQLVDKQLADLQAGRFTDAELAEVKRGLENQYLSSKDLASNILSRRLVRQLLDLPEVDELGQIRQVTPDEVVAIAKMVKKQAVYLLSGEN